MDQEFEDEIDRDLMENGPGEPPFIRLAKAEQRVRELSAERNKLFAVIDDHNSGSKQLAKWLEESRLEAMEAKRRAASDRARVRMMRVDLKQLLEGHRKHGITGLFLAIEEFLQKAVELDR